MMRRLWSALLVAVVIVCGAFANNSSGEMRIFDPVVFSLNIASTGLIGLNGQASADADRSTERENRFHRISKDRFVFRGDFNHARNRVRAGVPRLTAAQDGVLKRLISRNVRDKSAPIRNLNDHTLGWAFWRQLREYVFFNRVGEFLITYPDDDASRDSSVKRYRFADVFNLVGLLEAASDVGRSYVYHGTNLKLVHVAGVLEHLAVDLIRFNHCLSALAGVLDGFQGCIQGALYKPNTDGSDRHSSERSEEHEHGPKSHILLSLKISLCSILGLLGLWLCAYGFNRGTVADLGRSTFRKTSVAFTIGGGLLFSAAVTIGINLLR